MINNDFFLKNQDSVNNEIVLECKDTVEFTKGLQDESIQLIITSPPYNIGKSYETRVSIQEYLNTQMELIAELVRGEIYNVIRQGKNTPAVPLVIIGIAS